MATKELVALVYCAACKAVKANIFGVESGPVRQNVTEPASLQDVKQCPDCEATLEVRRT